jgi:hypothetical protein
MHLIGTILSCLALAGVGYVGVQDYYSDTELYNITIPSKTTLTEKSDFEINRFDGGYVEEIKLRLTFPVNMGDRNLVERSISYSHPNYEELITRNSTHKTLSVINLDYFEPLRVDFETTDPYDWNNIVSILIFGSFISFFLVLSLLHKETKVEEESI